jgi:hypothetical protein
MAAMIFREPRLLVWVIFENKVFPFGFAVKEAALN